jgi:tyrosyl-tRNA synthetase
MTKTAPFLEDLKARGLIAQATPGFEEHVAEPRTLYCGTDPTADSLHLGHLIWLLTLRRFQLAGHHPIILVGGATGMIGDPSFKAQERKLLDMDTLRHNVAGLEAQTRRIVPGAKMVNNHDWTAGMGVLTFLRDIGKHFSVNNLIGKEAIKSRLERDGAGLSYTEFTYPLLQAFDFQHLIGNNDCTIQIGGSDQWGNMTAGTELIRKTLQREAHVMTMPLVVKADGTKFGKSESGTVWLDARKTSPYAFYQFWLNTADAEVEKYLLYFSFRSVEEIGSICAGHSRDPGKRVAQIALAEDVTTLVHGADATQAAQRISAALFGGDIAQLSESDFAQLAQDGLPSSKLEAGGIVDALTAATLASSKREARDFLKGNAVSHNGQPVTDESFTLTPENAAYGKYHLLRRGKKNYALLVHG